MSKYYVQTEDKNGKSFMQEEHAPKSRSHWPAGSEDRLYFRIRWTSLKADLVDNDWIHQRLERYLRSPKSDVIGESDTVKLHRRLNDLMLKRRFYLDHKAYRMTCAEYGMDPLGLGLI